MSLSRPSFAIALILLLSGCVATAPQQPQAPSKLTGMDLYLPGDFKLQSESNFFERAGYRIQFEKSPAVTDSSEVRLVTLPGGVQPLDRAGVLGSEIKISADGLQVPETRALHQFSAMKDKQEVLNGLCIGDLDLNRVDQATRSRLLGTENAGKTYGKNLFSCFLIGAAGSQYQLVMVNDFAIGGFTQGVLTDGNRWFTVKNLRNLVNTNGTKVYQGYNTVGYQVESGNEILSALRIFNSYKVWLKKEMDLELKQALSATMAVLNSNYNSGYRGAVVTRGSSLADAQ